MITLIWAEGPNKEVGLKGKLPWSVPEDIAFFKNRIKDRPIIVGRVTHDNLPISVLRNSEYVYVVTENPDNLEDTVIPFESLPEVQCNHPGEEIMVLGGVTIYNMFEHSADRFVVTKINIEGLEADAHIPYYTEGLKLVSTEALSPIATVYTYERY